MIDPLIEHFAELDDPRCPGKIEHRLIDILVIAVCAVLACAESWEDIALYGRSKLAWLRQFLALPNGNLCHIIVRSASRSRFNVDDHRRCLWIAGLGKMDLVTDPLHRTLGAIARLGIRIMENVVPDATAAPQHSLEIDTAVFPLPPGLPPNAPIEITFRLDEQSRLYATALELSARKTIEADIQTERVISPEEVAQAKARATQLVVS